MPGNTASSKRIESSTVKPQMGPSSAAPKRLPARAKTKWTLSQCVHLFRRFVIVVALLVYVTVSIRASASTIHVLLGSSNAPVDLYNDDSSFILDFVGNKSIRESPLVTKVLGNDLTPRENIFFLDANGVVSTEGCSTTTSDVATSMYKAMFSLPLVHASNAMARYNVTELQEYSVVALFVDCSFPPFIRDDTRTAQLYYVMRHHEDANDMLIDMLRFSMQDYRMKEQHESGPIGLSANYFVRDMRDVSIPRMYYAGILQYPFQFTTLHVYTNIGFDELGWSTLKRAPKSPMDPSKIVKTSSRTGFYVRSDTEQANVMETHWVDYTDPASVLSKWQWRATPHVRDSWGWVHLLHAIFASIDIYNALILFIVVVQNYRKSRIWLGDAFVSVSTTLLLRAALLLFTWAINGFWMVMEFTLHDAHELAGTRHMLIFSGIMQADLLTIFLACIHLLGTILRERIDPAMAILAFEIGFLARLQVMQWFPSICQGLIDLAHMDRDLSVQQITQATANNSPLRQWSIHKVPAFDLGAVLSAFFPIFGVGLFIVLLYVLCRKIYRRVRPDDGCSELSSMSKVGKTASSASEAQQMLFKRSFTLFELATGAELQSRYGIAADYQNFRFIKGLKYASADGIFGTGYVIANEKYLVAVSDIFVVALMKLTHMRLKNVYMYEVTGNTAQQTAHLVYQDTMTWYDLMHLNVTILS